MGHRPLLFLTTLAALFFLGSCDSDKPLRPEQPQSGWIWSRDLELTPTGIWACPEGGIYVCDRYGRLARFHGETRGLRPTGRTDQLSDIWGSQESNVFVIGEKGLILNEDTSMNGDFDLTDVWCSPDGAAFAVTRSGGVIRYNP